MSQPSDNPIRQGRRRAWAQKILPSDWPREMREVARKLSQGELEEIAWYWLTASEAVAGGDSEMHAFIDGTFGPWAAQIMRWRAN